MQALSPIDPLVFIVCPDREYARGLRRHLVQKHGTLKIQVGTFEELVELATLKRMLDLQGNVDDKAFLNLLSMMHVSHSDVFWGTSFVVDATGVASSIAQSIDILINALGPNLDIDWSSWSDVPRISHRLGQLWQIAVQALEARCLPLQIQKMLDVIASQDPAITPIFVLSSSLCVENSVLRGSFLQKLNRDCEEASLIDDALIAALTISLNEFDESFEASNQSHLESNLATLCTCLFNYSSEISRPWNSRDHSARWVRCRDSLESIELSISAIQRALLIDQDLLAADFGLLIPKGFTGHAHLKALFDRAGLPLANLRWTESKRNLTGELLSHALMAFEGGCPKLALNSLISNPLMPWSSMDTVNIIESLDRHGIQFKVPSYFKSQWRVVLDDFRGGVSRTELIQALGRLRDILNLEALDQIQLNSFEQQFLTIYTAASDNAVDFETLRQLIDLSPLLSERTDGAYLDGVTVWYEDMLPWREVKHLFVLDFVEGNYPTSFQNSAVFGDTEWRELLDNIPTLRLSKDERTLAQRRLVQQLHKVAEQVAFLCPAFDLLGNPMNLSSSFVDCALVADCLSSSESLLLDVREPLDHSNLEDFVLKDSSKAKVPRFVLSPQVIDLKVNLLERFKTKKLDETTGQWSEVIKPQSPSALDDLLLCPLGWFLKQIGADNRVWEPEGFTPATSGLIAHDVLEKLFAQGQKEIPSEEQIRERVEPLFIAAVKAKAPFLNTGIWKVERQNLFDIVRRATIAWAELLTELGATVVAPELWLEGNFDGHPIHGQTDCVIALPDESVLIVDFKTSKADKYEKRMRAKFDLQASLYEQMLKTGGPKGVDKERAAAANLKRLSGVLYFTLKDRLATSNYRPALNLASWQSIVPRDESGHPSTYSKDVSSEAMALLKTRFDQLRSGKLVTIDQEEIKQFSKVGFQQYIFESSPLLKAAVTGIEEEIDGDDE